MLLESYEDLVNTGRFLISSSTNEYDNEAYDTPVEATVIRNFKEMSYRKLLRDDEYIDVNVFSTIYEDTYNTHGRLCLVLIYDMADIIYEPYQGLQNVRMNFRLCERNSEGRLHVIEQTYGFISGKDDIVNYSYNYVGSRLTHEQVSNMVSVDVRLNNRLMGYGNTLFGNNVSIIGDNAVFEINIPIFISTEDAENYIATGVPTNDINTRNNVPDTIWYYDYYEYQVNEVTKAITSKRKEAKAEFKLINASDKVRFVKTSENFAELIFNCDYVLLRTSGNNFVNTSIDALLDGVIYYEKYNGWYGDIDTNIPFVNSFDDDVDDGDRFTTPTDDNFTGEKGVMDNADLLGVISPLGCYYVSSTEFNVIKSWLYSTDASAIETLKSGLWQYNDTPIGCVIDIAYLPFDISAYVITESKHLQFGSLIFDGSVEGIPSRSYNSVVTSSKAVTNISTRVLHTYNDFRDYSSIKYSLYMPYYGIIELDSAVVGQTLTVKSYFDAWSTMLKYYVYIGSSLVGTYASNVGKHISVTGNDWLSKSKENLRSGINTVSAVATGVNSALFGNVVGLVNAGASVINESMNQLSKPQTMTAGTMSDGINVYDDMNFYLIIEENETIKPINLYQEYGIPCYLITQLNKCSGFTLVTDCKIKTSATDIEKEEILSLLSKGIII